MHVRRGTTETYRVRDVAKTTVVLGNVGVVQARDMSEAELRALVDEVGADALCVHLNPAMEVVQPEGDRDFTRGLETIGRLVRELGREGSGGRAVPIIVKETGCGIGPQVAARLASVGVAHVDVSGAGGTSWVGVEAERAAEQGDVLGRALGEAFWDWGIPTAACVALLAPLQLRTVIATGGVSSGIDVAKAIALGATAAGVARPVLKALVEGGREKAGALLDLMLAELRTAMLLTGSPNLAALGRAPRVLGGDLSLWVEQLSKTDR